MGAAMAPGEAIARVGAQVADIGQEMLARQVQLARSRQLMEVTSTAALAANTTYETTIADPNVPNEHLADTVQKGLVTVHDKIAKGIKDPEVRLRFDENFSGLTQQHVIHATSLQREREISASVASLNTSNQTLAGLAVDHTGQQLDADMAHIEGNLSGAVAHGMISQEQAQAESHRLRTEIYSAKFTKEIRDNPFQAYKDLQDDTNLDPVKKQDFIDRAENQVEAQLRQAEAAGRQAKEEAAKQRKMQMDSEATQYEADLAQGNGKATLPRLVEMQQKYATGGEPLSRETFERLHDLTLKPEQQPPSDPTTLAGVEISVNSTTPISMSQLHNLYLSGKINLDDYAKQSVVLEKNVKELADKSRAIANEYRAHNEPVIADLFGGDKSIHQAAQRDLNNGMKIEDIEKKYAPAYKTASSNEFKTSQRAYESAIEQQHEWASGFHPIKHLGENPKDELVQKKTEEFLNAAKKSGNDLGLAPSGILDGISHDKNGKLLLVVGGHYIAQ